MEDIKITKYILKNIGVDCSFFDAIDIDENDVFDIVFQKFNDEHKLFLTKLLKFKRKKKIKEFISKFEFKNILCDIINFFNKSVETLTQDNNIKYDKFIHYHAFKASMMIPSYIYDVDDLVGYGYEELFRVKKIYDKKSSASFDTFFTSCLMQCYKNLSRDLRLKKYGNYTKTFPLEEFKNKIHGIGVLSTANDEEFIKKIDRSVLFDKIYNKLPQKGDQRKIFNMLMAGYSLAEIRKQVSRHHVRKFIKIVNIISKRMKIS